MSFRDRSAANCQLAPVLDRARHRLLVAVDDSELAPLVLRHALDHAARHDAADIDFVKVVRRDVDGDPAGVRLASQVLAAYDGAGRPSGNLRIRLHVRCGTIVDEITRIAADLRSDLIVVGRFGAQRCRISLTSFLVEAAPCPVFVVAQPQQRVYTASRCDACVSVRERTNAETLFCSDHAGNARLRSSALVPCSSALLDNHFW
jgi:nucleotide-binding universal stress UspA family protein